jgi:cytochrome c551/c552
MPVLEICPNLWPLYEGNLTQTCFLRDRFDIATLIWRKFLKIKTMTLKKSASLALMALAVSFFIGCSSKEDRDKYDHYYGSGSKAREEASLVKLQNDRKVIAEQAAAAAAEKAAAPTAAPAAATGDSAAAPATDAAAPATAAAPKRKPVPADVSALLNKHACFACHQAYDKVIGPAYSEVAKKKYTPDQIVELVHNPKPEHWPGYPPMAPLAHVPKADIVVIANWINSL